MPRFRSLVTACALFALLSAGAAAAPTIYTTHLSMRGADGRHYSGDAVIFPRDLFPHRAARFAMRTPFPPRAGALSSGPFRFTSVFEAGHAFDPARHPEAAALHYYLYVPGAPGDVVVTGFVGWIELDAFSLTFTKPGGKVTLSDLLVRKEYGQSSPIIWNDVNTGKLFDTGGNRLTLVALVTGQPASAPLLKLTFLDGLADSYSFSAAAGIASTENIRFASTSVQICYAAPTPTGSGPPTCVTLGRAP
jgi:hypothetical protein